MYLFLAPLDKGSKLEELVKGIRTRKGLKASTWTILVAGADMVLFIARHPPPRLLLRQVVIMPGYRGSVKPGYHGLETIVFRHSTTCISLFTLAYFTYLVELYASQ